MSSDWHRRDIVKTMAVSGLAWAGPLAMRAPLIGNEQSIGMRPIPSTGESVPIVGLGTWQTFDVGRSSAQIGPLRDVLRQFVERGGRIVDSSPMYGRSEQVVGDLAADLSMAPPLFYATKVWTRGREAGIHQMEQSFERMRVRTMDLMQIHNLVDWRTHLATLRDWKASGRVRYLGVTHYQEGAYDEIERVVQSEPIDFVQIHFSIGSRTAEQRLLPFLGDRGIAVLINRPFQEGDLFARVRSHPVPSWGREFDCDSWAQFFLKYILSETHVTCVIPATSNARHVADNMGAGYGRLPDADMRRRMVEHFERL